MEAVQTGQKQMGIYCIVEMGSFVILPKEDCPMVNTYIF